MPPETFDPKPALKKYDGQLLPDGLRNYDLAQINTADSKVMAPQFPFHKCGQSGLEIASIFPRLAGHADKLAIIRSMHHQLFIHGSAMIMMNSGTQLLGHPSIGLGAPRCPLRESENLPAYIAMTDSVFRRASMLPPASSRQVPGTDMRIDGVPIQNRRPESIKRSQRLPLSTTSTPGTDHHKTRDRAMTAELMPGLPIMSLAFRMQTAAPGIDRPFPGNEGDPRAVRGRQRAFGAVRQDVPDGPAHGRTRRALRPAH